MKSLIEKESCLAMGKSNELLNINSIDAFELVSMILRTEKGHSKLADAITNNSPENTLGLKIETIRNYFCLGNIDEIKKILNEIRSEVNYIFDVEVEMEYTRYLVFTQQFELAIQHSDDILNRTPMSPLTRMTIYQLRGHSLISLGNYSSAILELEKAINIGIVFPRARSFFSALGFIVLANTKIKNKEQALYFLNILKSNLDQLQGEDLWPTLFIVYLRSQSHFEEFNQNFTQKYKVLKTCMQIALWLNDKINYEKCKSEILNLNMYKSAEKFIFQFSNWVFISSENLILHFETKTYYKLDNYPLIVKMINLLCEGEISYDDFFESIWNQKYSYDLHNGHVRSYISKIRKFLPKGSLEVKSEVIRLK